MTTVIAFVTGNLCSILASFRPQRNRHRKISTVLSMYDTLTILMVEINEMFSLFSAIGLFCVVVAHITCSFSTIKLSEHIPMPLYLFMPGLCFQFCLIEKILVERVGFVFESSKRLIYQ